MRFPSVWLRSMMQCKGYISRGHALPGGGLTSGGVGPVASGVFSPNLVCLYADVHIVYKWRQDEVRVELGLITKVAAERLALRGA